MRHTPRIGGFYRQLTPRAERTFAAAACADAIRLAASGDRLVADFARGPILAPLLHRDLAARIAIR